jgi:hypothetical protein
MVHVVVMVRATMEPVNVLVSTKDHLMMNQCGLVLIAANRLAQVANMMKVAILWLRMHVVEKVYAQQQTIRNQNVYATKALVVKVASFVHVKDGVNIWGITNFNLKKKNVWVAVHA